uniref:Secreted protein n=1 Tax=Ixodes ricinus TaxID=34613 RepID=A0A147BAD4_IXORI
MHALCCTGFPCFFGACTWCVGHCLLGPLLRAMCTHRSLCYMHILSHLDVWVLSMNKKTEFETFGLTPLHAVQLVLTCLVQFLMCPYSFASGFWVQFLLRLAGFRISALKICLEEC